jgi:hypothetical protein
MTVYGIYLQDGTPLALFDAVEVAPIVEDEGGNCERATESDTNVFWSVYLRYDAQRPENAGFAGLECVADLPTEESATAYAAGLRVALQAVRKSEVDHA